MTDGISEENAQALQNVKDVHARHADELLKINQRLAILKREFVNAVEENDIGTVFYAIDEYTDNCAYDTQEFSDMTQMAQDYGMGFSYEDYYLWQPSTRSC